MAEVGVIGLGYVGLTTAIGLASLGHSVTGYDTNKALVKKLVEGEVSIHEEGLQAALKELADSGRLRFTSETSAFFESEVEFFFVCVPTPQSPSGKADLSFVLSAVGLLSSIAKKGSVIVLKSSVPIGSAAKVISALSRPDLSVASNPEFLREGSALADFMRPERIIVGSRSEDVTLRVFSLFDALAAPRVGVSLEAAELIKYSSNAYLAMRLSFVNDLAHLCEQAGVSFSQVAEGLGLDSRIGHQFMIPGPGWGGSCFPKDTLALLGAASDFGVQLPLVEASIASNSQVILRGVAAIRQLTGGSLAGKIIGVWGLAFKAGTDDIRESPAVKIVEALLLQGCEVRAYDPAASATLGAGFMMVASALEAAADADVLAVLTEWPEFSEIDPRKVVSTMRSTKVFDSRRILPADTWDLVVERLAISGEGAR
jgi:UDPglucose 6-dehydrogenase